jgi:hypothetical protein
MAGPTWKGSCQVFTEINLDGKSRNLRFSIAAFRALEDAMGGRPIGSIVSSLSQLSFTAMSVAIWAGCRHEDKRLTVHDVDEMLEEYVENGGDLSDLARLLSDAISESAAFKTMGSTKAKARAGNALPEPTAN